MGFVPKHFFSINTFVLERSIGEYTWFFFRGRSECWLYNLVGDAVRHWSLEIRRGLTIRPFLGCHQPWCVPLFLLSYTHPVDSALQNTHPLLQWVVS